MCICTYARDVTFLVGSCSFVTDTKFGTQIYH